MLASGCMKTERTLTNKIVFFNTTLRRAEERSISTDSNHPRLSLRDADGSASGRRKILMYRGIISCFSAVSTLVGDACAILLTLTSTLVGLRAPYGTFWSGSPPGP